MTADVELLQLPKWCYADKHLHVGSAVIRKEMRAYTRANVAHATELLKAEIERLRAERDSFQRVGIREQERAERLVGALRNVRAVGRDDDGDYARRGEHHATCVAIAERALLRDHDQETKK